MTKPTCVHGLDLDWECDLCWDLVEEKVNEQEKQKESE